MPGPTTYRVSGPFTQIARLYQNKRVDFVAATVAPVVKVTRESGTYYRFDERVGLGTGNDTLGERAPSTPYPEVDFDAATATYQCREYGFSAPIDHAKRDVSDYDLTRLATVTATERLLISWERRVVTIFMTAGNWATSTTNAVATDQWDDPINSDPHGQILTAMWNVKSTTGARANTIVISERVWRHVIGHSFYREHSKYKDAVLGTITPELFEKVYGLKTIIAGAIRNTATQGQAASTGAGNFLWGRGVWVGHLNPAPANEKSVLQASAAYTLAVDDLTMEQYEDPKTRSTYARARHFVDIEVGAIALGHPIVDAISAAG